MHDRKNIGKLILDPAQTPKPKPATPAKGKSKDKKQVIEEKNGEKDKKVQKVFFLRIAEENVTNLLLLSHRLMVTQTLKKRKTMKKLKRMEPMVIMQQMTNLLRPMEKVIPFCIFLFQVVEDSNTIESYISTLLNFKYFHFRYKRYCQYEINNRILFYFQTNHQVEQVKHF